MAAVGCVAAMGASCVSNGDPTGGGALEDSVLIVFSNNSQFEVDPTVDGEGMETIMPGRTSRPIVFDCTRGERFDFSGSVRTLTQTLPSPYDVSFNEGMHFACGDTIRITYYMNADNDLDLDGFSF